MNSVLVTGHISLRLKQALRERVLKEKNSGNAQCSEAEIIRIALAKELGENEEG